MNQISHFLFILCSSYYLCDSYAEKILYISPIGCKSTSSFHLTLKKCLISHGHEILAMSPFPANGIISNYSDIDVSDHFITFVDKFSLADNHIGTFTNLKINIEFQYQNCEKIYMNKKIVNSIKNEKIDLVILEVDGTECFLPFVSQFNVPIIGVSTTGIMYADFDGLMGNPVNPSYMPMAMSGFSTKMGFSQRLQNIKNYIIHWLISFYYNRKANILVANYMESPALIEEVIDKISIIFCNSHFSFIPKPVAPNSIGIGGIHIKRPSPLPQDIKNFIDGADDGVIYISLGSVVQFSMLPKNIHDTFVNTFKKLPYRIIWRHDKPKMVSNISENILVRYWLPQIDILAEQKIILFISHNGMFSTYEAIHNGIPILSFPVLYDQFTNAAITEDLEIGKSADLKKLNETLLLDYIKEVIQNKKYRENMSRISKVFKDRPQSPEETFMYWVAYVLKHKDVSFLKPVGSKLPFYQYLLLDVVLFVILIFCFLIMIIHMLMKAFCSLLCKKKLNKIATKMD